MVNISYMNPMGNGWKMTTILVGYPIFIGYYVGLPECNGPNREVLLPGGSGYLPEN